MLWSKCIFLGIDESHLTFMPIIGQAKSESLTESSKKNRAGPQLLTVVGPQVLLLQQISVMLSNFFMLFGSLYFVLVSVLLQMGVFPKILHNCLMLKSSFCIVVETINMGP